MHVAILFVNIGSYHAARLRAAQQAGEERGWKLTAVQLTNSTLQHPWGDMTKEITFPVVTLTNDRDRDDFATISKRARGKVTQCLDHLMPDAVLVPGWGFAAAREALGWSRAHGCHTVLMSESKYDDEKRLWWKEAIKSRFVRQFGAALVGGELHREYVVRLGMPRERTFLGYDVVDNDFFSSSAELARSNRSEARSRQTRIPEQPYFLGISRFIARKNLARLIEAYIRYRKAIYSKPWDLVLLGNGTEETRIRQSIRAGNLEEHVHLPGFAPYQALGDWYGLAHAFVHPAVQEPWGLVINEACAAGLPVLSSRRVGAAYELVTEGKSGYLFDPEKVEEISKALMAIHSVSSEARKAMGGLSRLQAQRFAPSSFGMGMVSAIEAAESVGPVMRPRTPGTRRLC